MITTTIECNKCGTRLQTETPGVWLNILSDFAETHGKFCKRVQKERDEDFPLRAVPVQEGSIPGVRAVDCATEEKSLCFELSPDNESHCNRRPGHNGYHEYRGSNGRVQSWGDRDMKGKES